MADKQARKAEKPMSQNAILKFMKLLDQRIAQSKLADAEHGDNGTTYVLKTARRIILEYCPSGCSWHPLHNPKCPDCAVIVQRDILVSAPLRGEG